MTGIVTAVSLDVPDGLPASPIGLLNIAKVFEAQGYERLGRYLRACADQMSAAAAVVPAASAPVGVVFYPGATWERIPGGQEVRFLWEAGEELGQLVNGQHYSLVPFDYKGQFNGTE